MTVRSSIMGTAALACLLGVLFPAGSLTGETENLATGRPAEGQDPALVHFFVFLLDIDNINGADQSFTANIYVRLRWKDDRLAHSGTSRQRLPLEDVWNPRIVVANQQGIIRKSLPETVEVEPDGTVIYRQRYIGVLSQPLRLSEFPMDQHIFTVQFAAVGYTAGEELVFVPDAVEGKERIVGGGISKELSLTDWDILEHKSTARPYEPIPEVRTAGFAFQFKAKRHFLYYFWQVIVPLVVIVAMSWAGFWIDPSLAGSQISVATSSVLTLIAYRFVMAGLLPRLPYMTRMDYFLVASTLLVFLALIEVVLTAFLAHHKRGSLARRIDRLARLAFPAVFLFVFVLTLFGG